MNEIRKSILISHRKVKQEDLYNPIMIELSIFVDVFRMCQATQTFPRAGGLLDQDSLYIFLMRYALDCQDERRQLDEAKNQTSVGINH